MSEKLRTAELFKEGDGRVLGFLHGFCYPWEALAHVKDFILELGKSLDGFEEIKPGVWVSPDARVSQSAHIEAPAVICEGAEIRHCAYIRGSAYVGRGAVVGNSTELKNCILQDYVQVPHYNYVGDSILGYRAHMGAGSITSNVKGDKSAVVVEGIKTERKKVGAMIGDYGEVGCGAVLNPGAVIGVGARVYPLTSLRGFLPPHHIYKGEGRVVRMR